LEENFFPRSKNLISEKYIQKISEDWLWREAELREIDKIFIGGSPSSVQKKSAVLITYSHWEGHFKTCAQSLLEFISECIQRKVCGWTEVKINVRQRILLCSYRMSNIANMTEVNFVSLLNNLHDDRFFRFTEASDAIILTDSNLNSSRASAICQNLGVDPNYFLTKRIIIDQRILEYRNAIAHGGSRLGSGEAYDFEGGAIDDGLKEMRSLIRSTKDNFTNAIALKTFVQC